MAGNRERVERRLAAIFAADVAGYSRLMEQDEVGTLRTLTAHREIMDRLIAEHGGRIANTAGDSVWPSSPARSMPSNVPWQCRRHSRKPTRTIPEERASNSGSGYMSAM